MQIEKKLKNETPNLQPNLSRRLLNDRSLTPASMLTPKWCQIIACTFFAFMVLLGAIPGEAKALSDAYGDKLLHLCAYSFLTLLLFGGLNGTIAGRSWRVLLMIGVLGGVDEGLQGLLSYRSASAADWLVDMLAAGLTLAILLVLSSSQSRRDRRPVRRIARPAEKPN